MDFAQLVLLSVVAGYGDPVDGYPSDEERALVLWTNAARVAPDEFKQDYRTGGCTMGDFSADEKTAKAPLYLDLALTEVARVHSRDMRDNGCFQHDSCDGTDTWTRVGRYYTDANGGLGENIAYGTTDPRYAVMSMWMCSHEGHRANIMSGSFNEMGGGMASDFLTQDFAAGELKEGEPPVRVAAEYGDAVYADWGDDAAPARLQLNVDGQLTNLESFVGDPDNGVYYQSLDVEECTPWVVEWETRGGESGRFPATGALLAGNCAHEYDGSVAWGGTGGDDDDVGGPGKGGGNGVIALPEVMCGTGAGLVGPAGLIAALLLAARRRARVATP